MKPLSPRERKLVAIAILIAAIFVAWSLVLDPLIGGFAKRAERRTQLQATYAANARLIAKAGRLRAIAEQQARALDGFSVAAPDQEQAAQLLAERLSAAVSAVGGQLRSADPVDARPGWARVSAAAVMTRPQWLDWMARLQSSPPWLVVESLQINADRAIDSTRAGQLEVKLDVSVPFRATRAPATLAQPR